MARKRPKSGKSRTRKKAAAAGAKKKPDSMATPPHHDYENLIGPTATAISGSVQAILGKLKENDANKAPTQGIIERISALTNEFTSGETDQTKHDNRIELILYAIAQMNDQYKIGKSRPDSNAAKPTKKVHEKRVVQLFTTINSICRDILELLKPNSIPGDQPDPDDYTSPQDVIVALANDTKKIVDLINQDVQTVHGRLDLFSK